jgi:hypothetical protein
MRLPTELRLEICCLAFQHDLNVITAAPEQHNLAKPPYRGALALLHTSHTLRTECLDAVQPLALAVRDAMDAESEIFEAVFVGTWKQHVSRQYPSPGPTSRMFWESAMLGSRKRLAKENLEELRKVLASVRDADEKMTTG